MNDAAGPRPGREPESASFDLMRVGRGGRGRQPAIIVASLVVLAGVVMVGVGGRTAPAPTPGPAAIGAISPVASPVALPSATRAATRGPAPTREIVVAGLGGPLELRIRRPAAAIFVHGDVFAVRVTWVFISLQDASGEVKGWASVSVPGSAVPGAIDGPSLRFDIDVAIPPELAGRDVWVQAIAYDATGKVVGTTRAGIRPDGQPVVSAR